MSAIPLHVRVPLEYAIVLGINAALAFLYAEFARADFWLALAIGLSLVAGFWVIMKLLVPATRGKGIHFLTLLAVIATASSIFRVV